MRGRQERDAKTFRQFCAGVLDHPKIDAYAKMGLATSDVQSYFTTQFMNHLLNTMSAPNPESRDEKITDEERNVTQRLERASGLFMPENIQAENPIQPRALDHTARLIAINFVRGLRSQKLSSEFATELNTSLDIQREGIEIMDDLYTPDLYTVGTIDRAIGIYKRDMGIT